MSHTHTHMDKVSLSDVQTSILMQGVRVWRGSFMSNIKLQKNQS